MEVEFVMGLISLLGSWSSGQNCERSWRQLELWDFVTGSSFSWDFLSLPFIFELCRSVLAGQFILAVFAGHKYSKRRTEWLWEPCAQNSQMRKFAKMSFIQFFQSACHDSDPCTIYLYLPLSAYVRVSQWVNHVARPRDSIFLYLAAAVALAAVITAWVLDCCSDPCWLEPFKIHTPVDWLTEWVILPG